MKIYMLVLCVARRSLAVGASVTVPGVSKLTVDMNMHAVWPTYTDGGNAYAKSSALL